SPQHPGRPRRRHPRAGEAGRAAEADPRRHGHAGLAPARTGLCRARPYRHRTAALDRERGGDLGPADQGVRSVRPACGAPRPRRPVGTAGPVGRQDQDTEISGTRDRRRTRQPRRAGRGGCRRRTSHADGAARHRSLDRGRLSAVLPRPWRCLAGRRSCRAGRRQARPRTEGAAERQADGADRGTLASAARRGRAPLVELLSRAEEARRRDRGRRVGIAIQPTYSAGTKAHALAAPIARFLRQPKGYSVATGRPLMLDKTDDIAVTAEHWLAQLEAALSDIDATALTHLFHPDSYWRDVLAFSWTLQTLNGADAILAELKALVPRTKPTNFQIDPDRAAPRRVTRAGTNSIEAIFKFETAVGRGHGILRLIPDADDGGRLKAWTLLTALEELKGFEEQEGATRPRGQAYSRDFRGPNWLDQRNASNAYA